MPYFRNIRLTHADLKKSNSCKLIKTHSWPRHRSRSQERKFLDCRCSPSPRNPATTNPQHIAPSLQKIASTKNNSQKAKTKNNLFARKSSSAHISCPALQQANTTASTQKKSEKTTKTSTQQISRRKPTKPSKKTKRNYLLAGNHLRCILHGRHPGSQGHNGLRLLRGQTLDLGLRPTGHSKHLPVADEMIQLDFVATSVPGKIR